MKHYTETTHIYQPNDDLIIEILHDGTMYIKHNGELVDLTDFNITRIEDVGHMAAISEVVKIHIQKLGFHFLPPIFNASNEQ